MDKLAISEAIKRLATLNFKDMHHDDFLLTWEKSDDEIAAVMECAEILRQMREANVSSRIYDSGLAIANFRDNSTRTRTSFISAANMLGLSLLDLDEEKSQIAHGETVRETMNMLSFMAEVIGIRDDIYLGEGNKYMRQVSEAVAEGFREGVLPTRPSVVNLQCDKDHPTQSVADALHLIKHFGGLDRLAGRKLAMTWAYSPSYGKPLSVAQGTVAMMTRLGMDVTLAYPEGYTILPEVEQLAARNAEESGGDFRIVHDMDEAFSEADVVYPKSWAPLQVMESRTQFLQEGKTDALKELEKQCLENNRNYMDWECTEERMKKTYRGEALYMHCLPADISGESCMHGEVERSVFDRYRVQTYKQASNKPYVIAAMILLSRVPNPAEKLMELLENGKKRVF
jgi:knotted carbamoyltransferase YgeW